MCVHMRAQHTVLIAFELRSLRVIRDTVIRDADKRLERQGPETTSDRQDWPRAVWISEGNPRYVAESRDN
jgi:hypothetical protein